MKIGTRITTWGFPAGYSWLTPLLTVGYLAGVDQPVTELGVAPIRWVVNAAFNSGNSGGPIIDDDGEVIGVVVSKLLPVPQQIQDALQALGDNCSALDRNSACYGYNRVQATFGEPVEESFFSQVADRAGLTQLQTLQTL